MMQSSIARVLSIRPIEGIHVTTTSSTATNTTKLQMGLNTSDMSTEMGDFS